MQLSTYLHFKGDCDQAFQTYQKVLGGEITMKMTYGGSPMESEVPADWKDKIIHVSLQIGEKQLLGSDSPPQYQKTPEGFSVCLELDTTAEVDRVFNALVEGGQVRMPLEKTFFAERFGMLVDRYGTPWIVGCMRPRS